MPVACATHGKFQAADLLDPSVPEKGVEILSPRNNAVEMAFKIRKYFECGFEQIWIADPEAESIQFYFQDGRKATGRGDEVVACEGLAEGLYVSLREIFKKR